MEGNVKFFDSIKGFGFIKSENGQEYFVHGSSVADGVELDEGNSVTFEIEQGNRGPKAVNVNKK